jgi:hypothetical protein
MPAVTSPLATHRDTPVFAPPARVRLFSAVCSMFGTAYGALDLEPSPVMAVLLIYGPMFVVVAWLAEDTKRRIVNAHDLRLFFYLTWPVTVIWYALHSRGLAGWWLAIRLYALLLAGYVGFVLGRMLRFFLLS